MKREFILLLTVSLLVFCSCLETVNPSKDSISAFTMDNGRVYYIFNDDEPNSVLVNESLRSFNPKNPVQISITSKQEFLLRSYSPRMLKDMKIWAKLSGYPNEEFLLASFDVLPPFVEYTKELPFIKEDIEYKTLSGKTIKIMANPYISANDLTLRIECPDPLWAKYQSIKVGGTVKFSNYGWKDGHTYWRDMKPVLCREACAMSINSAYMFSSQRYLDEMKKYDGNTYGKFINNLPANARTGKINDMLNAVKSSGAVLVDFNDVVKKSQSSSVNTRWGRVVGVGGLGGGYTLGLGGGSFVNHYGDDDGGAMAWFHELGHCMGYGDATNTVISWGTLGQADDGKEYYAWRYVCQELYVKMCVDKELPIYSKYFLNSRQNWYESTNDAFKFYSGGRGHIIDIPKEEEKWFGGKYVSVKEVESDPEINKGDALNFEIDYQLANYTNKNDFKPHRMAVYGNKLYVLNRVSNDNCALDIFDLSSGTPKFENRVKEIKYQTIEQSGNGDEYKTVEHNTKLNNVRDIYRSYDKIYINHDTPGKILVLNDKYEYVDIISGAVSSGLMAAKGFVFGFYSNLIAVPEALIGQEVHIIANIKLNGSLHDNNRLTLDNSGNLWAIQYTEKKMRRANTDNLSKYKMSVDKEVSFSNANFKPSAVCFVSDNVAIVSGNANGNKNEIACFDVSGGQAVKKSVLNSELGLSGNSTYYCIMGRNTLFVIDDGAKKIIAKPISSLKL